jgi:hypothetical protein
VKITNWVLLVAGPKRVGLNIHFGPPSFQIINFQFLTIYEIQIWSQTSFFFLVFGLREERESRWIIMVKKESLG